MSFSSRTYHIWYEVGSKPITVRDIYRVEEHSDGEIELCTKTNGVFSFMKQNTLFWEVITED